MTTEKKQTKTLVVLTKAEKEKAAMISEKLFGKRNYSGLYAYFLSQSIEPVRMKFKDAPIGARFRYHGLKTVWIKINSYPKGQFNDGSGLICQWNGNVEAFQSFCCSSDEILGFDFDTEVELL